MTSQLDFLGAVAMDGPAPDGVAGSLTDDIEKPKLEKIKQLLQMKNKSINSNKKRKHVSLPGT